MWRSTCLWSRTARGTRLNHSRSFQIGGAPSRCSAPYVGCSCAPDNPEWPACHVPVTQGNTHTHVAVGGDGAQRAAPPPSPFVPQSHESTAGTAALCAPTRTHTGSRGRYAGVPVAAGVADPAGDVSRGVRASLDAHPDTPF